MRITKLSDTIRFALAGQEICIRPIDATDTRIESNFVRALSPEAKHRRFFCAINELTPEAARKFCQVDGDHTMAYIATIQERGEEIEIGVSRFAPDSLPESRELAITVADAWKSQGLEVALMRPLIEFARKHGVKRLYSIDFADDVDMRKLAHGLGMSAKPDPDDTRQTIYSLAI